MAAYHRIRSIAGPDLPDWLLRELHAAFHPDLHLQWRDEYGMWELQAFNRRQNQHVPFAYWDHSKMDRRLIDTLHSWDGHKLPRGMVACWEAQREQAKAAKAREIRHRRDMGPVIEAGRKLVNDFAGYPRIMGPIQVPGVLKPTVKEAVAVGMGVGRAKV